MTRDQLMTTILHLFDATPDATVASTLIAAVRLRSEPPTDVAAYPSFAAPTPAPPSLTLVDFDRSHHDRGGAVPDSAPVSPLLPPPPPPPAPGDTEPGPRQLIINYLPSEVTDDDLRRLFATVGEIEACRIVYNRVTGRSKGFGFIYYRKHADAEASIVRFTGYGIGAKRLKVSYAVPQRPVEVTMADIDADAAHPRGAPRVATNPSSVQVAMRQAPDGRSHFNLTSV
jgi:hypothetical protein